jgi:hypothetical protein
MNCFFLRSSDAKISTCSTTGVSDEWNIVISSFSLGWLSYNVFSDIIGS